MRAGWLGAPGTADRLLAARAGPGPGRCAHQPPHALPPIGPPGPARSPARRDGAIRPRRDRWRLCPRADPRARRAPARREPRRCHFGRCHVRRCHVRRYHRNGAGRTRQPPKLGSVRPRGTANRLPDLLAATGDTTEHEKRSRGCRGVGAASERQDPADDFRALAGECLGRGQSTDDELSHGRILGPFQQGRQLPHHKNRVRSPMRRLTRGGPSHPRSLVPQSLSQPLDVTRGLRTHVGRQQRDQKENCQRAPGRPPSARRSARTTEVLGTPAHGRDRSIFFAARRAAARTIGDGSFAAALLRVL